MAWLIIPYGLACLNLFLGGQLFIFDYFENDDPLCNFVLRILRIFLSPFLPFILITCECYVELKQQFCQKDEMELWSKRYRKIKDATSSFIRTELGCETTVQSFLGLLLLFFSVSSTRTADTLSIFDDTKGVYFFGISPITVIVLSNIWSLFSGWRSFIRGLQSSKNRFPILSQAVLAVYVAISMISRVVGCLLFMTPCLGLFNCLRHFQGLLLPYYVLTRPEYFGSSDVGFYSNVNFTWDQLSYHDYTNPSSPVAPNVTIFTVLEEGVILIDFWILFSIHVILMIAAKCIGNPDNFYKMHHVKVLSHCIENVWIPAPIQDWDHGHATLDEYRKRRRKIDWEIGVSTLVNLVISILMLIPVQILALNVNKRHQFLLDTIGPLPEEIDAHWKINFMAVWMVPIFIGGALVQFLAYCAYNRVFHPFQEIMTDPGIEKKYSTLKSILATPIYNF